MIKFFYACSALWHGVSDNTQFMMSSSNSMVTLLSMVKQSVSPKTLVTSQNLVTFKRRITIYIVFIVLLQYSKGLCCDIPLQSCHRFQKYLYKPHRKSGNAFNTSLEVLLYYVPTLSLTSSVFHMSAGRNFLSFLLLYNNNISPSNSIVFKIFLTFF